MSDAAILRQQRQLAGLTQFRAARLLGVRCTRLALL